MNRTSRFIATFLLPTMFVAHSKAQTSGVSVSMSTSEIKRLIKNATTSSQYKQVATYYQQQETVYRAKAADEKAEQERRAKINAALYQKYPRPEDSSRNRYEAFCADADRAALMAAHYNQLAAAGDEGQRDKQSSSNSANK